MIFSTKCQHAIRALTYLARSGKSCAREISRNQKLPYHFTGKILQVLQKTGFVRSVRGAGGGFVLTRPASKIRLIDVWSAIDGTEKFEGCLYGLNQCSELKPCPLHENWTIMRRHIEKNLSNQSIADLTYPKT
ncbi:MAG: Rrf2 family transcriptional regulator [Acidobacteria bacterium]|nr:Rrf2 family transcriptional regulator [Acidobacteriota bacterium]